MSTIAVFGVPLHRPHPAWGLGRCWIALDRDLTDYQRRRAEWADWIFRRVGGLWVADESRFPVGKLA